MTMQLEGPAWDERREKYEQFIAAQIRGRGEAQGWFNDKGKLNAKGKSAAMEFVFGMAAALHMVEHEDSKWLLNQAFLVAVRGVEERFLRREAA